VRHAVAVASGTDALTIVLSVLKLRTGTRVVTSAFGFFATVAAILRVGAVPEFVDINLDTFTMDSAQALNARRTGAEVLLPVHLFGFASDVRGLLDDTHAVVVEDAAQAFGAKREGVVAGTSGVAGVLSFNWSKNLAAVGNGGAIITNDDAVAAQARVLANYGMSASFTHTVVGLNSRLDPLEAVVLSVKLRHVDKWNERRRRIAARYYAHLFGVGDLRLPASDTDEAHVFHKYAVLTEQRDALRAYLATNGVETMVFYPRAQHQQPCLTDGEHLAIGKYPRAESVVQRVLCLPMFPELTDDEVDYVSSLITDFFRQR